MCTGRPVSVDSTSRCVKARWPVTFRNSCGDDILVGVVTEKAADPGSSLRLECFRLGENIIFCRPVAFATPIRKAVDFAADT